MEPMVSKRKELIYGDFGKRLNEACRDRAIAEENRAGYLADLVHITKKGASKWLKGQGMPDIAHGTMVATDLGVSFEWLMTGRPPKHLDARRDSQENQGTYPHATDSIEIMFRTMPTTVKLLTRQYIQSLRDLLESAPEVLLRSSAERAQYEIWKQKYAKLQWQENRTHEKT